MKNSDETTITHEIIHHMRCVDERRDKYSKTAYPMVEGGYRKSDMCSDEKELERIRNAEETATCVEAELRTKILSKNPSGYWRLSEQEIAYSVSKADREKIRSNEGMKEGTNITGTDAIDAVNRNYPKTQISTKLVNGETALETFKRIFRLRGKGRWRSCPCSAISTHHRIRSNPRNMSNTSMP